MEEKQQQSPQQYDASYSHVLKYTGLFGGVQVLTMLVGVLRTKVVAIFLGPTGLALINIYNNVVSLLNQCTNMGISFSAVKDVAEKYALADKEGIEMSVRSVRAWCVITAIVGTLMGLVLSPLISLLTFGNYSYTSSFALLSPMVGMLAITGGEMAILKGLKCLKRVAAISVVCAIVALFVYLVFYGTMGTTSIVPALLLSNLGILLVHLYYSTKVVPWRWNMLNTTNLKYGMPFIKLGVAYIVAGAFGQGAEYVMRALMVRLGGVDVVGLYNCGYIMIVSYASLVFMAVENDYFPRLSAVKDNRQLMCNTVNKQIEVCVLLVAPILVSFVILMPWVVRLLFSAEFVSSVNMATCAVFYMFFKSLTLPVAYLPLSHGDSKIYVVSEVTYDVLLAIAIPSFYYLLGLEGTGWALTLMGLFDLLFIHIFYYFKYGYRFKTTSPIAILAQFALLAIAVYASLKMNFISKCIVGCIVVAVSGYISLGILNKETHLFETLKNKFFKSE